MGDRQAFEQLYGLEEQMRPAVGPGAGSLLVRSRGGDAQGSERGALASKADGTW